MSAIFAFVFTRRFFRPALQVVALAAAVFFLDYGTTAEAQTTVTSDAIVNTYIIQSSTATFTWSEIEGATSYWAYLGTTRGANDIYNSGPLGTEHTITVHNIPLNGETVWLRVWYLDSPGLWRSQDFGYGTTSTTTTATTTGITPITFRANPATIGTGESSTLIWDAPRAASCSASGGWSGARAVNGSEVVRPTTAFTRYILDCEEADGASGSVTAVVEVIDIPTRIVWVTPDPGSILPDPQQRFSWNEVRNATDYWVYMGSAQGASDIFNTNGSIGNVQTATVTGIPADGRNVWLRIFYKVADAWISQDFSYETSAFLSLTATPSLIDVGESSSIAWSTTPTATSCSASGGWSGTRAPAGTESVSPTLSTTYTLTCTKPDGSTRTASVLVEVLPREADGTTAGGAGLPGITVMPPSCSVLETPEITFSWSEVIDATDYWVYMGSTPGGGDIFNTNGSIGLERTVTIQNIPQDGSKVWLTIFYRIGGLWESQNFLYVTLGGTCPVEDATPPPPPVDTGTTGGTTGTVTPVGLVVTPPPESILEDSTVTFSWTEAPGATDYWVYMGSEPNASDIFNTNGSIGTVRTVTISNIPLDGRDVWLKIFYKIADQWVSESFRYHTLRFMTFTAAPTAIRDGESSTLTWAAPTADQCVASVGWSGERNPAGGSENVSPTDSTTYTLTCSKTSGTRSSVTRFVAVAHDVINPRVLAGLIVTPPPGSLLETREVVFSWSDVGATDYWVYMGSTEGGFDIFNTNASIGTIRTVTVTGIPLDGRLVWLKIFYKITDTWLSETFGYRTAGGILGSGGATTTATSTTLTPLEPIIAFAVNPTRIAMAGDTVTLFWSASDANTCSATSTVATSSWDGARSPVGSEVVHASSTTIYTLTCTSATGGTAALSVTVLFGGAGTFESAPITVTPAPGSKLTSSSVTFSWTSRVATAAYWVSFGTASGGGNVAGLRFVGTSQSATISNIPLTGNPVWLRIIYLDAAGGTFAQDFSYETSVGESATGTGGTTTTGGTTGSFVSGPGSVSNFIPTPGSTLNSPNVTFSWGPVTGVAGYWAAVGKSQGSGNIFSIRYLGSNRLVMANNIPLDGRPVWLRVTYLDPVSGFTKYTDVSYGTITLN